MKQGAWTLVGALVGAAVFPAGSVTAAQDASAPKDPVITRPEWVKRPDGSDLLRVYPAAALRSGRNGRARLSCEVSVEGTLQRCKITDETPAGQGFGAAALALAPQFQMRPQTVNGRPVSGARVVIPIAFQTAGPTGGRGAPGGGQSANYVTAPIWTTAPTRAEVAAVYPAQALARGEQGRVLLDCGVSAQGRLERCRTGSEQPGGREFGAAALRLAPRFQMTAPRDPSGTPLRNLRVRTPVFFAPSLTSDSGAQIARPEWGRLPDAADVMFPAKAKAAGVASGDVTLDCRVQPGGAVSGCSVVRETPAGMGFGEAALKLAPAFVMKAWTSDGRPVDGARVRIPVRFEP